MRLLVQVVAVGAAESEWLSGELEVLIPYANEPAPGGGAAAAGEPMPMPMVLALRRGHRRGRHRWRRDGW